MGSGVQTNTQCLNFDSHVDSVGICKHGGGSTITLASGPTSLTDTADTNVVDISVRIAYVACKGGLPNWGDPLPKLILTLDKLSKLHFTHYSVRIAPARAKVEEVRNYLYDLSFFAPYCSMGAEASLRMSRSYILYFSSLWSTCPKKYQINQHNSSQNYLTSGDGRLKLYGRTSVRPPRASCQHRTLSGLN